MTADCRSVRVCWHALVLGVAWSYMFGPALAAAPPSASERLERLKKAADNRSVMMAEYSKIDTKLKDTQVKLAAAVTEVQTLTQDIQRLQAQIILLEQSINELSGQLGRARGSTAGINAQINVQEVQQRNARGELGRAQQQLTAANVIGRQLTTRLQTEEGEMKSLRTQADRLKNDWLALIEPLGSRSKVEQQALIAWLDPRLATDSTDEGGLVARALACRQLGQTDNAVRDLDNVISRQGVFTTLALAVRGGLLIAQGRDREGNADFALAMTATKTDPLVYAFRGQARAAKGQFTSAEADFKLAAQLGKTHSEGHRLLALFYATCPEKGRRDGRKALAAAKQAVTLSDSKDWSCLDALAAAEAEMGNFEEAVKHAQAAADLATDENRVLCQQRAKQYEAKEPLRLDWK